MNLYLSVGKPLKYLPLFSLSILPKVDSSCCKPFNCYLRSNYDTIIKDTDAKSIERAIHTDGLSCIRVLIEGVFKVDTSFYFNACNVSLAPNALIEVVDSSDFHVQQGPCETVSACSHLHAACDSMWRGIFVHPGSTLWTIDETLIEDADTAIYAMNTSSSEGLYRLVVSTFNKNYKDIVVTPYPGKYDGTSANCLYTCRNFDSILSSYPANCVAPARGVLGNWQNAPFDVLKYPFAGQKTAIGWEIDTVRQFTDSAALLPHNNGINTFDNMTIGIVGRCSSMTIYSDLFQYINSGYWYFPAIYAQGWPRWADRLIIGGSAALQEPNTFRHCTTGVLATSDFATVNICYNSFHFDVPNLFSTYGIITAGPMWWNSTITIDSNTIDSASMGIIGVLNKYSTTKIDSNIITGASLCYPEVGVFINELGVCLQTKLYLCLDSVSC